MSAPVLRRLAALGLLLGALAPAALAQVTATNGLLDPSAPEDRIVVSWTNGSPTQGTNIYYAEVVDGVVGPESYLGTTPTVTSTTFSRDAQAIRPGVEYRFRLRRFDPVAGAFVEMGTAVGARVPLRPETLGASEGQPDGVALSWTDRSSAEFGYVLYRGATGDDPTVAALTEIGRVPGNATSYLDDTAANFYTYQYCVGLLDRAGGVEAVVEPLACDSGIAGRLFEVSATAGGAPSPEAHVQLTWTPTGTPGELYEIYRHRIAAGDAGPYPVGQLLAVGAEADSVYLDAAAVPGQDYRYCVRATASGDPSARPEACATGSRELRGPTVLTASDSTRTDGVVLRWTDRSSIEAGYAVFRGAPGTPDGSLPRIASVGPDATAFLDETADDLTTYRYCVALLDTSTGVELVGTRACDDGTRATVLPPSGVAASDGTLGDRVRVRWDAPAGAASFSVYRTADGGTRQLVVDGVAASPYDDVTAADGVAYVYCVTAVTDAGESVATCDAGRRGGLAAPTAVDATDGTADGLVEITWADPGTTETGFRIYRQPDGGLDALLQTVAADRTRFADRTAAPGQTYTYCVVAIATATVDGADVTSESGRDPATACDAGTRAELLAPGAFAATDAATGDEGYVELTWESESDVVQLFRVVRDGTPIATLPPFARSYRDATALSGATYTYKVQSVTVIGVDPNEIRQGLAPVLTQAEASREALAADRAQAAEQGAAAVARVDARAEAAEGALVQEIETLLGGLGVDATGLAAGSVTGAGLEIRDSAEDAGSRILPTPGSLAVTTTLEDRIRVTWADRSGIETDYEVRALYTPTDSVVVFVGPNRTEFVDVDAPAGADVTYRVRALDRDPAEAASGSAWAEAVGGRVLATPEDVVAVQTENETELLVTWTDASRAETGTVVTADLEGGEWTGTTEANGRRIRIPLQPADFGRSVLLTVAAVDAATALAGAPSQSEAATLTITPRFLPPSVVTASTEYTNQVVVSWSDDSAANDGYRVVRRGTVPDTLDVSGTTAIDYEPTGPATYCVVTTRTGAPEAEPAAVCAEGRISTSTAPSTGDVVTTFTRASPTGGLGNFNAGDIELIGAELAAEDGLLVMGAQDDGLVIEPSNPTPSWMRPPSPTYSGDPQGTRYDRASIGPHLASYFDHNRLNVNHFEAVRSMGFSSFYERTADGGWSNVSNLQVQPTDAFTYRRFGADVDIEGDVAIIGAPGPATFHTHPTAIDGTRTGVDQYMSSITYADGGAYIYRRNGDGSWSRAVALRALGFQGNQYTSNDAETRYSSWQGNEFQGVSSAVIRTYRSNFWFTDTSSGFNFYNLYLTNVSTSSRTLNVERMGELVALSESWAYSSFVYLTRPAPAPQHVIGVYRATGEYSGFFNAPEGFDSATGSLAADANLVAVGSVAGHANLYETSGAGAVSSLVALETLLGSPPSPSAEFGASIDVETEGDIAETGELAIVGAPGSADNAVYIFRRVTGSWQLEQRIVPEAGDTRFGTSVAIGDGLIAIGAEQNGTPGVAYTFRLNAGTWEQSARLTPEPAAGVVAESRFGAAVAADADDLIIGAPGTRAEGRQQGSIYFATVSISPSNVEASDGRYANRVQIRWEDESDVEDGYRVYRRGPADDGFQRVGTLAADTEIFDDFDVSPGDAYQYCVASYLGTDVTNTNPLGESGRTCDAGYTPPNGTISGRLATGEGAAVRDSPVCLSPGLDQAVMFDGIGGRAVAPSFGSFPATFTVGGWVNADAFEDGANPVFGVDGGSYAMLEVIGASGEGVPRLRVRNGTDSEAAVSAAAPLAPGWHHVAATLDGETLALYVDGQPVGSTPFATVAQARGAFQIASNLAGQTFDGRVDDVRVWSRALTAGEVLAEVRDAVPLEGDEVDLYAYWAVDQGTGRILTDLTEGGRHATLRGGAEWTQEAAPLDACALTDGDGNYTFSGLRYGETTAFRVVPTDSTRQFTPAARTATLTPESPTTNLVDFTDTSSYTVRGRVVHTFDAGDWPGQAPLPAPDVEILVDGQSIATTESDGTFAVAVRGAREHVFEARNDSLGLAFVARFDGADFDDGSAEITLAGDVDGLVFENTTRRILRGQATGGCGFGIGDVTYRLYTEDRRFDHTLTTMGADTYAFDLPPLEYRLEFVSIGEVPGPISRTSVIDYFRNLGVLTADLTSEADTVDLRYRAPITLAVERDGDPFAQSTVCTAPYTVVDADGNAERTLPNVPVIGEYERVPLTFRAFEDYGAGNECAVEAGTVRIFDGFADAAEEAIEVELAVDGTASYTTFGRSPDTFSGRTVGGVDRSYQKSLTAVLEVPDGPTVTATEWAFVEGFREKEATFVTAPTAEIPLMVLRDPPGSQSSAFVEEGTKSCLNVSTIQALSLETGASFEISLGFKTWLGLFVITGVEAGVVFSGQTTVGGTTEQSLGRDANIQVCASTTERLETNGGTGWSSEDLFAGVGLNLLFAEADVVTTDVSSPAACEVRLSTTVATDIDARDPFETTFTYGTSHIEDTLLPELESLADLIGGDATIEGEVEGAEASFTIHEAIANWEGMLAHNDSLATEALAGEAENRSFSAGTSFQFGTAVDTTWTSVQNYSVSLKNQFAVGPDFEIGGNGAKLRFLFSANTETKFNRTQTDGSSFSTGYTLADDDAGDSFTVDVAQDPRFGTYVFNTVSGASSNPWEDGTQKRDLPRLAVDPPVVGGLVTGDRATYTVQLTNASESGERREYVIEAPGHLNPTGAVVKAYGAVLSSRTFLVDANTTVNVPITVERGPGAEAASDTARVGLVTYSPFDHAIWRTAPFNDLESDTVFVEARFTPTVAPLRLTEPLDGWAVNRATGTVQVTLSDIDTTSQARFGVEYRRPGEAWAGHDDLRFTAADLAGADEIGVVWEPEGTLADGRYELRAVAYPAAVGPPPYLGPTVPGWIDRTAPAPFGPPEPADVVLALGETIGITFEEPIDCERFRDDLVDLTLAQLVAASGVETLVDVGCAERTVLLAPEDPTAWASLEGQVATARLRGVHDLAGNPMGPATEANGTWDQEWTFTVRRNAFGWTPAVVEAVAQPGSPTEVRAALVNGRAQPVTYDLVPNNPAFDPADTAEGTRPFVFDGPGGPVYLTAAGYSGTLVSGEVQPVVFRWPDGVTVEGSYTSRVGVASAEGSEDLGTSFLDLRVEVACAAPAWAANAAAFERSMSITADLQMAGATSADPADVLAAFVDGEVRGVGWPASITTGAETVWRVMMNVYGTGAPEQVTFQAWDQDACALHTTTSQVVEFVPDGALGTTERPLLVEAPGAGGGPLEVPLAAGWTLVSTNRTGTSSLATALVGVGSAETDLIRTGSRFSQFVPGSGWFGDVAGMDPGLAYQLYLAQPATMTHPGGLTDPTAPIGLVAGWNWLGYLPATPLPLNDALANDAVTEPAFATDDVIKGEDGVAFYFEGSGWIGSFDTMVPGQGYLLRTAEDGTLVFPAAAAAPRTAQSPSLAARPVRRMDTLPRLLEPTERRALALPEPTGPVAATATAARARATPTARRFEHSMVVAASLEGAADSVHVAAYAVTEAGEALRAVAPVERVDALDGTRAFLLVPGEAGDELVLRAVVPDGAGGWLPLEEELSVDDGTARAAAAWAFDRDAVVGSAARPVVLSLGGATATDEALPLVVALSPARPNPTAGLATFEVALPTAGPATLEVFDVLGRRVAVLAEGPHAAGVHEATLDARALAAGTYVARLLTGDDVRVRTFTVVR